MTRENGAFIPLPIGNTARPAVEALGHIDKEIVDPGESVLETFPVVLEEAVANLYKISAGGEDFFKLLPEQQINFSLKVLKEFYSILERRRVLYGMVEAPKPVESFEVTPHPISLTIRESINSKKGVVIELDGEQKELLAAFAAESLERVGRFRVPWIKNKEMCGFRDPSYNFHRLVNKFFVPLKKAGLLDSSRRYGYKLLCDPSLLREVVAGDKRDYEVVLEEDWGESYSAFLLIDAYLSFLRELQNSYSEAELTEWLDVGLLADNLGKGVDIVTNTLRELEKRGIIAREFSLGQYKVGDVNWGIVAAIIRAQEDEVDDEVMKKAGVGNLFIEDGEVHNGFLEVGSPLSLNRWQRAASLIFRRGEGGFEVEDFSLIELPVLFEDMLRELARRWGVDYDDASITAQYDCALVFLSLAYEALEERMALIQKEGKPDRLITEEVGVTPQPIFLTIESSQTSQPETIDLGQAQKEMLAVFAGVTAAKLRQYLVPWVTRRELRDICEIYVGRFSIAQLSSFLRRLTEVGLLTLSKRWGHGLNCPPAEIYEVVGGINREHTIGVVDFDEWWSSPPLLKPHLARLVSALSEFAPETIEAEDVPLKVEEIGVRAGVHNRSMRYRLFRELKAQEIITRNEKGYMYMVTDVDWDLVKKIAAALDKKTRVELITSGGAGFTSKIDQKRSLVITSEVEFIYPDQSWRDLGIEVAGEVGGDTAVDLVNLLGEILFTPLKQQLIPRGKQSFSAILPIVGDRLQSDFFAMLDFLGLGRAEILRLKEVASTITDAAFLIKETKDVVNNHLVDAVKAQIAVVLTRGGIAEVEPDVSFKEITDILEKRLGMERASFAQAILRQQKAPSTEPVVRLRERLEQMTPIDLRMKPVEGVGQKRFTLVIPEGAFDEYREEKEREQLWRAVTDYAQKGIGSDRHYYTDMTGPLLGGKLFSLRAGKLRILFEIMGKGEASFITVFSRGDWNKVQKNYLA